MESDNIDISKLRRLPLEVFFVSDLIAYCVNIPASIITVFIVLHVGGNKIIFFSAIMLAVVCAAGILTVFQLRTFFIPVVEYFRKISSGEDVTDEEYLNAKIRFYSAPLKRAVSGMIAWIVLMPVVIVLLVFWFSPSFSAKTVIFSALTINIISVGSLYYIGIDLLIRKTAKSGIFSRKAAGEEDIPTARSSTVLSVTIIGFVAILCALMIPIVNELFYQSAYSFFTGQMRQNTNAAQSSITTLTDRYALRTVTFAENSSIADAFNGNTSGIKILSQKFASETGSDFDSILLLTDNNELKPVFSYGGDLRKELLSGSQLIRAIRTADQSMNTFISAVISPASGKPVLSFIRKLNSGFVVICINTDSFRIKELSRMRTGSTGYCIILDRFNTAAIDNNTSQIMREFNDGIYTKFLSDNEASAKKIISGDTSFLMTTGYRNSSGIRAVSIINDSEIESYGVRPVLFMSVFLTVGLLAIGYGIYRILRVRLKPLEDCRLVISAMGNGDLSVNAVSYSRDDIGQILTILLEFTVKLRSTIRNIHDVAKELAGASAEMSLTSDSAAQNAQSQAASVEEVTATSEEITAGMQNISEGTISQFASLEKLIAQINELAQLINGSSGDVNNANFISRDISKKASDGSRSLGEMNESISRIASRSGEMTNIVGIINDISDRINLLSLNAAIEAARAGDSGRGFAVVADEISKLADQTAVSIKEIDRLIRDTNGEIGEGLATIEKTTQSIGSIIDGVETINAMMDTVAVSMNRQSAVKEIVETEATEVKSRSEEMRSAAEEQKRAMDEVMKSITSINDLTQDNAEGSEKITVHAQKVKHLAETLSNDIEFFKL